MIQNVPTPCQKSGTGKFRKFLRSKIFENFSGPTFLAWGRDVLYHISVSFANFLVGSKAESQELYLVYGMPKETGCILGWITSESGTVKSSYYTSFSASNWYSTQSIVLTESLVVPEVPRCVVVVFYR